MITEKDIARFWAKVDKNGPTQLHMESPCWVWTALKKPKGYGQISIGQKMLSSHRVAWLITNGPIPHDGSYHGLCVLHRCDNPSCCRPDHLFLGTNADNARDRDNKGRHKPNYGDKNGSRLRPESRPRGERHYSYLHPERLARGEANAAAKLTNAKVIDIRARHAAGGITQRQLGVQFGVSDVVIGLIVRRKTWNHI